MISGDQGLELPISHAPKLISKQMRVPAETYPPGVIFHGGCRGGADLVGLAAAGRRGAGIR